MVRVVRCSPDLNDVRDMDCENIAADQGPEPKSQPLFRVLILRGRPLGVRVWGSSTQRRLKRADIKIQWIRNGQPVFETADNGQ